jgi:hypothetical protein
MGPERVIDIVAERAPNGFDRLDDVISHDELLAIAMQYRKVAGFERARLAEPASPANHARDGRRQSGRLDPLA